MIVPLAGLQLRGRAWLLWPAPARWTNELLLGLESHYAAAGHGGHGTLSP